MTTDKGPTEEGIIKINGKKTELTNSLPHIISILHFRRQGKVADQISESRSIFYCSNLNNFLFNRLDR